MQLKCLKAKKKEDGKLEVWFWKNKITSAEETTSGSGIQNLQMRFSVDKRALFWHELKTKSLWSKNWGAFQKPKKLLGWKPKIDLKEGLKRTVRWYLENKH